MATSAQTSQRPTGAIHPIAPTRLNAPAGRPDAL
ncbi:MAG: heme-copper oxidase subunit III, partial [Cutibacterium acnes]